MSTLELREQSGKFLRRYGTCIDSISLLSLACSPEKGFFIGLFFEIQLAVLEVQLISELGRYIFVFVI